METVEIVADSKIENNLLEMSNLIVKCNTECTLPLQSPEIDVDLGEMATENEVIADNRLVGALGDMSIDTDYTPSEEKVEMEFTPVEEKPSQNYDVAMDNRADEWPPIDFFIEKNVVELARCSWRGSSKNQRYLKGCLWSPDGTCLLTTVNGDGMHVFETPRDLFEVDSISPQRPLDCLQSVVHVKEGGIVYDYCWFPLMNSNDPATCW